MGRRLVFSWISFVPSVALGVGLPLSAVNSKMEMATFLAMVGVISLFPAVLYAVFGGDRGESR